MYNEYMHEAVFFAVTLQYSLSGLIQSVGRKQLESSKS
jgi:hypothetical protein